MCGIIGAFYPGGVKTAQARKIRDFLLQALYADAFRGWDSTGLFAGSMYEVAKDEELILVDSYKQAISSCDFLRLPYPQKFLSTSNVEDYLFVVGHNRAATRGATSDRNAHPFQHKDVTLVHNGTLGNYFSLPGYSSAKEVAQVDSEAIAIAMGETSPEEVVPHLNGSFAIVGFDERTQKLFITANGERPFHVGVCPEIEGILFCSEKLMLQWIADRNNLSFKAVFSVGPDKDDKVPLYQFSKDYDTKKTKGLLKYLKPKVKKTTHSGSYWSNVVSPRWNRRSLPAVKSKPTHVKKEVSTMFKGITADNDEDTRSKLRRWGVEPLEILPISGAYWEPYGLNSQGWGRLHGHTVYHNPSTGKPQIVSCVVESVHRNVGKSVSADSWNNGITLDPRADPEPEVFGIVTGIHTNKEGKQTNEVKLRFLALRREPKDPRSASEISRYWRESNATPKLCREGCSAGFGFNKFAPVNPFKVTPEESEEFENVPLGTGTESALKVMVQEEVVKPAFFEGLKKQGFLCFSCYDPVSLEDVEEWHEWWETMPSQYQESPVCPSCADIWSMNLSDVAE